MNDSGTFTPVDVGDTFANKNIPAPYSERLNWDDLQKQIAEYLRGRREEEALTAPSHVAIYIPGGGIAAGAAGAALQNAQGGPLDRWRNARFQNDTERGVQDLKDNYWKMREGAQPATTSTPAAPTYQVPASIARPQPQQAKPNYGADFLRRIGVMA